MKHVVIVGAGGLGRELLAQLHTDIDYGRAWDIAGFLDERGPAIVRPELKLPWLGSPHDYQPQPDQYFVTAIGDPASRERQLSPLIAKEAVFIEIRTQVVIGVRSHWGASVFGYNVSCGIDCHIGNYCHIDRDTVIGHDVIIGDYAHIGAGVFIGGNVHIGKGVVINPGAIIAHKVHIGDGAVVGLGAVVFGNVPAGTTVIGNPARRFSFKAAK